MRVTRHIFHVIKTLPTNRTNGTNFNSGDKLRQEWNSKNKTPVSSGKEPQRGSIIIAPYAMRGKQYDVCNNADREVIEKRRLFGVEM